MSPVMLNMVQLQHENKTWSRLLDFFKQENAILKTRLAEVVDQVADKGFLAHAEYFQNKFIIKDEFIDELRRDINIQINGLTVKPGDIADHKLIKRQEKLRNEIEHFEKEFMQLKNEFNKYLSTGGAIGNGQ